MAGPIDYCAVAMATEIRQRTKMQKDVAVQVLGVQIDKFNVKAFSGPQTAKFSSLQQLIIVGTES